MIPADAYLHLPEAYARWLGGLRWSTGGEAIEFPGGETFVFGRELSLFLDGFASARDPIHFAHILHLMHLLIRGPLTGGEKLSLDLPPVYAVLGRPHRNAGAFCATLCADVPPLPDPPDAEAVCLLLTAGAAVGDYRVVGGDAGEGPILWGGYGGSDQGGGPRGPTDEPPMGPAEFERAVIGRMSRYFPEQIRHWLRLGRPPEEDAGPLARRIEAERPRSYRAALEALLGRPRLSASAALIDRLVGGLALPPRRRALEALPTGGYADVANRGHPERLLPSQHALDAEEFLRRFAEHELLYYRREEPHAAESEELVVLLDQGVRTWGGVRPVLAAAAVALARLADRRGIVLRLGVSGEPDRLLDPIATDPEALAAVLEASDLSRHPGALLASAIAGGSGRRRDLVLLTHPRTLDDPGVGAAAGPLAGGDRLFAVLVNDRGEVRLAEVRGGRPAVLSRFRVEAAGPRAAPPAPRGGAGTGGWEGDVEPIGFPFLLPMPEPPPIGDEPLFAFDEAGEWFAAVGALGVPHAWRLGGGAAGPLAGGPGRDRGMPLPRGFSAGQVVRGATATIGVAGGFAVLGRLGCGGDGDGGRPAAVHYDFASRRVRVYEPPPSAGPIRDWYYVRGPHALIARGAEGRWYIDLKSGRGYSSRDRGVPEAVARELGRAAGMTGPPPRLPVLHDEDTSPSDGPSVRLRRATGTVALEGISPAWRRFRPLSDGEPVLAGCRLVRALYRGRTLALYADRGPLPPAWLLFRGPDPAPLPQRSAFVPGGLALSADGDMLAVRDLRSFYVAYAEGPAGTCLAEAPGRAEGAASRVEVGLGRERILILEGRWSALVRWGVGGLDVRSESGGEGDAGALVSGARRGPPPPWAAYDPTRFEATARGIGLVAVVDRFGQVVLSDAAGSLVCMMAAPRGRFAAWMPDGTRFGPADVVGGPPTPGAAERIAAALRAASRRG